MVFHRIARSGVYAGVTAAAVLASCTVKEPTEFVPGVSTQVRVPKDLAAITIAVSSGGALSSCLQYDVLDGTATLPGTLGVVSGGNSSLPVTITVRGYTQDGLNSDSFNYCTSGQGDPSDYTNNPRVLRRTTVSFVSGETLFLPFPLHFACFDQTGCSETETCKAGQCVDATVDAGSLPTFEPGMGDGTGTNCFDPTTCFLDRQPAYPLDVATCKFTFPVAPKGTGLNVQAFFGSSTDHEPDGGSDYVAEYLDIDPDEGFVQDPNNATQFTLAPGLCTMFQAYAALQEGTEDAGVGNKFIYSLDVASICQPKSAAQPICAAAAKAIITEDAAVAPSSGAACNYTLVNQLNPVPSALLLLLDRSWTMSPLFGAPAFEKVLGFSIGSPAFANTEVGLKFVPTDNNICTSTAANAGFQPNDISWTSASKAQAEIATAVSSYGAVELQTQTPMGMDALLGTSGVFDDFALLDAGSSSFNRRAVLIVTNTDLTDDCTDDAGGAGAPNAASGAAAGFAEDDIYTYVIMLKDPFDAGENDNDQGAIDVADAGGTTFISATTDESAATSFNQVIADLATCLYSLPTARYTLPAEDAGVTTTLQYAAVSFNGLGETESPAKIPLDPTCTRTTQATSNGWNVDPTTNQIRVCGSFCTDLQTSFINASSASAATGITSLANVPVILTTTTPCP